MKIEMRIGAMLPQAKKSQEPENWKRQGKFLPYSLCGVGVGEEGGRECDSENILISAFWPLEL